MLKSNTSVTHGNPLQYLTRNVHLRTSEQKCSQFFLPIKQLELPSKVHLQCQYFYSLQNTFSTTPPFPLFSHLSQSTTLIEEEKKKKKASNIYLPTAKKNILKFEQYQLLIYEIHEMGLQFSCVDVR